MSLLDKALQAILKMLKKKDEWVLIWQNASPTSTFAPQTINLDLSSYDEVRIVCNAGASMATRMLPSLVIPIESGGVISNQVIANSSVLRTRYFKTSATSIICDSSTVDADIVPMFIYGRKRVV